MLKELTEEQKKLAIEVRDEWIRYFDSCPVIKDEKHLAEEIAWVYSLANLSKPEVVIADSPLEAQVIANKMMGNSTLEYIPVGWRMGTWDYGWTAFYDFFDQIGVDLECPHWERWKALTRSGIFNSIQLDGLCVVSRMPEYIRRDRFMGSLHCTTGPAVAFKDGFSIYRLWGVSFDKDLFEKVTKKDVDAFTILKITNIEQRMAALKLVGPEKLLDAAEAVLVGESKKGNKLFKIEKVFPRTEYCLKYACPSTGRVYVSFVDPEVGAKEDPDAAMAWKFNITKKEYLSMDMES